MLRIMRSEKLKRLKRKSFFDLQKMICRIILSLVIMQSILARINIADIKTVSKTFVGEKQDVIINPRGPLNLLRGYIVNQNGYMYNKRFYSSEIDTDYALSKKRLSDENKQEYNFTRTPVNDRVHKDIATQTPNGEYLSTYHAQLIKMFPSIDGDLSIETGRPNALTNFLRAEHVKKDTKYILAALLLLSEGVDIKISVDHTEEKKKLVIKSKTCEEKVFVDVEMYTADIDPVTNEPSESIYQSETAEIVDFYLRCRDNPLLKKGGEFAMPATKKEFESGKFLNSAAFLIQTYIYEFIDTAEDYKNFVEAVHELLIDQVTEEKNPNDTDGKGMEDRIFDELLIAKEALSQNIKYIESFCDLVKAIGECAELPFYNNSWLPRFTRVPLCKLGKSGFESSEALYYSDYVESALLSLFCCLAYNPETGKYETSHMGTAISKEVKDFFEKYPKPVETINYEMHKEWCKVVACLKNDKIDYKQAKNELFSGIGNMLLAILEITRKRIDMVELIQHIESICRTGELHEHHKAHIQDEIESIIKSLSKNKNVRVEFNQMRLGTRSNGKTDIFGEIIIIYSFGRVFNGISLDIREGNTILAILGTSKANFMRNEKKYNEVENIYSSVDCYIGYAAVQYVNTELYTLNYNVYYLSEKLEKKVVPIVEEGPEGISKIFVLGKIPVFRVKEAIIMKFISYAIDKEAGPTNPLTRFTANLLGSVPLNNHEIRDRMISLLPIFVDWRECYPKLGYTSSDYPSEHNFIWEETMSFYKTILSFPVPIAVKATCNYLRSSSGSSTQTRHAKYFAASSLLFKYITSDGTVDNLKKIQSVIEKIMKDIDLNQIYICWFMHTCKRESKFSPEQISTVYSFILPNVYPSDFYIRTVVSTPEVQKCLIVLRKRKDLFYKKDDPKSMEVYNGLVKYIKKEFCLSGYIRRI